MLLRSDDPRQIRNEMWLTEAKRVGGCYDYALVGEKKTWPMGNGARQARQLLSVNVYRFGCSGGHCSQSWVRYLN
jgi:hypothetical protein